MIRKGNIFIILLICSSVGIDAQSIRGLCQNPVIKQYRATHPESLQSAKKAILLTLPFFEDFSASAVVPDPGKWTDQYAFINNSFADEPISIGVATLDAIDENGDIYALTDLPVSSDKLTSQDFDLSAYSQPGDTVRLSFYYQAGGKGEVPEKTDSLLLEFYSPADNQWKRFWFASLDTATPFQQVILAVPGLYYQSGFRFRFRNYTSLSAKEVAGGAGALSNVDIWNIDYIMMDTLKPGDHQIVNDIALIEPPGKLMDFYESVPWLHLNDAQSITRNDIRYVFRNLKRNNILNLGRSYFTHNLGTGQIEFGEESYDDFDFEEIIVRNDPYIGIFTRSDNSEEGNIVVGAYLITPEGQFKQNDTAMTILHFKDYYAYDDGTPEYGFGISGPSMAGALLACRFRLYKSDTLRAIDMLFNKTRNNFNADLGFQLCVWKDGGGEPGDLLYMSPEVFSPGISSGMNDFRRYAIDPDTNLVIEDTVVYLGWKQVSEEFLNLGFDVNRDNVDRTFINTSGDWFNPGKSIIPGTLMIRAVFGSKSVVTGDTDLPGTTDQILLYPNPVSEVLTLKPTGVSILAVSIFDLYGRLVLKPGDRMEYIDVSALPSGIYQVSILTDRNQVITRKIVVIH